MSLAQIDDIISGFDKSMRSPYSLFSFIDNNDEKNEYSSSLSFEDEIKKMFENTDSYILSEDSSNCNITSTDRNNYQVKLNELKIIINSCENLKSTPDKHNECIYNKLMEQNTINIITNLIEIIKKINTDCLTKNIKAEEKTQMCNSTELFNDFSSSDISKNLDFIKKYSSLMVQLKNISDINIKTYVTMCNKDSKVLDNYNEFQTLLSKALFEAKICIAPEPLYNEDKCRQVPAISTQLYNLQTEKQELENEITVLKSNNDKITQEYKLQEKNNSSFVWNGTLSFRNGWVYWGTIVLLILLIIIIGYIGFGKSSQSKYGVSAYRPFG
jgi:hypothetical protein